MKETKKMSAKSKKQKQPQQQPATPEPGSQPTDTAAQPKTPAPRKGKLGAVLGHSVVSVIRAMGKAGWDFETAKAALVKAGVEAAEHTIRIGLKRGRDGQKRIAPLSAKELDTLRPAKSAKSTAKKGL